jgi:hypothetical protein
VTIDHNPLPPMIVALGFTRLYLDIPGPRAATIAIVLTKEDLAKFNALGEGDAPVEVINQVTGYPHLVERGPCGLGCYCGARLGRTPK